MLRNIDIKYYKLKYAQLICKNKKEIGLLS